MRLIAAFIISLVPAAALAADHSPVGLGLYFADGAYSEALDANLPGQLSVVDDGRPRYLSELDVVQHAPTSDALGVAPVMAAGKFAQLDWSGVHQVPCHPDGVMEDWRLEIDGSHWMRSWCYGGARWMNAPTVVLVSQLDGTGHTVGWSTIATFSDVDSGSMWERRFVARVVAHGCAAPGDCSGATSTTAEALLQLRGNLRPSDGEIVSHRATALSVLVTSCGNTVEMARAPVRHDPPSTVGYGLRASLTRETPYPTRGYFVAGERVTLRAAYADDAGHRLHPVGQLPSYGAALFGDPATNGLRYLTFTDDPVLYWAHKNTQSDMTFTVAGPLDKMRGVGTAPITIADAFLPQIPTATVAPDGWSGLVQIFPPTSLVFPCLFSLATGTPAAECFQPVADTFTVTVPTDAQPGTWLATVKARRVWEGEPVQAAASVKFQVGEAQPTGFTPRMSGCARCHVGQSSLAVVGHGLDVGNRERPECLSCHTSGYAAWFEPDAGFDKRMSFIHLLSKRFFAMGGRAADVTY
jgi:hypothetical protein